MSRLLFLCAASLLTFGCVWGKVVVVGDSFTFEAAKDCAGNGEFALIHRLDDMDDMDDMDDSTVTVARRDGGAWMAPGLTSALNYTNRVEHQSLLRLTVNRLNINDDGLYEFTCRDKVVNIIQLEVVVPTRLSVPEGDTVSFPCHLVTAHKTFQSARWEKGGRLVMEMGENNMTCGPGYEGNVSVRGDWLPVGDLTLTLRAARLQDAGDYFCHINNTNTRPVVARLNVTEKIQRRIIPDHPTPSGPGKEELPTWVVVIITVAGTCFTVGPLSVRLGWWLKSRRSRDPSIRHPSRNCNGSTFSPQGEEDRFL